MNRARATVVTTVFAGASAWQAPANGRLAESVGALPASIVSFLVGGLFLLGIVVWRGGLGSVRSIPTELRGVQLRYLSGGLMGASFVVTAVLTVESLGTGGVIATSVAGTLVGAVAIDWLGLLGVVKSPPGPARWLGVALLVAGTVILGGGAPRFAPLALVAVFAVGLVVAFQPPVNARLARVLGGGRTALFQTGVGLAAICVAALVGSLIGGGVGPGPADAEAVLPWWALTGGLLGAAYVVSTLMSVPAIGAGGVAAASIAGGLAFGAVADSFGMFGLERIPLDAARLGGLAILAFGAALVLRRPPQQPGP